MPRLLSRNPACRLHKPSGQAVVTLNGQDIYLGPYGSPESRREYDRVIAEWLARGRQAPGVAASRRIADVIKGYWDHAKAYYGNEPGKAELQSIKLMLALLRRTYGPLLAREFGPLALQVVRERMIKAGWSRRYINAQIGRLKRAFKWACSRELIPPSVYHGLQAVDGLRQGKTEARECEPVKPVPEAWVEATLPHVSRPVAAIIRLQLATGMRPGEACLMRTGDIDTSGSVWIYRPRRHKTQHHGHERTIYLGPNAQKIVAPFLRPDLQAYLFSPKEAEQERRAELHAVRKTPESCGNTIGSNRARKPQRAPADRYTVESYRRAIAYGCDAAFPPPTTLARQRVPGRKGPESTRWESKGEWKARLGEAKWAELQTWLGEHRWHPHQLRHTAATRLRKQYGLEAARVVLGHHSAAVAEIYAEIDQTKARQIMAEVG
ncbi:MAG: tyrosine-type recombinase/integrase [Bacillota bacterium]